VSRDIHVIRATESARMIMFITALIMGCLGFADVFGAVADLFGIFIMCE
jgi:lipoprotein